MYRSLLGVVRCLLRVACSVFVVLFFLFLFDVCCVSSCVVCCLLFLVLLVDCRLWLSVVCCLLVIRVCHCC